MKDGRLPARRIYVLAAIMAVWGLGIAARLYFLQIVQSATYIERAQDQQQQVVGITPRRGNILDRNGSELAISIKADSVFARPNDMKNPADTAKALAGFLDVSAEELLRKFERSKSFVWVKRKVSARERQSIELANLSGVGFQKEFRRYYPNREMAAHLLGYVDIDEEGKAGLESRYNGPIHGQPGKILLLRDAHGKSFQREEQVPQVGATLTTTIDKNFQFIVEKELRATVEKSHPSAISIIVMDPNSGAILAMANAPAFNPNDYNEFAPSTWMNRSLGLTYEPGSTFKMVTVASALEEGLTTPEEKIDCQNGAIVLFGRKIKDHNPYGWLSVREIIQNSSNVGTIKLALRVGEERLSTYIDRMGFGQRTLIDLPAEVGGTVRETSQWTKTSIGSVAIGQEVSVTPLQIVNMVAAVANGGVLYKPYVVQKIQDPRNGTIEIRPSGRRVMSETTAHQLQEMLEDVVTDGTARASKLEGYRAAGKTGTAQKIDPATRTYSHSKYVASFAGFAPASNPQLAIVVVVDEPKGQYYGGEVAAPVFKRIAEQILQSKAVAPDEPHYSPHYTATPEKKDKIQKAPREAPEFKVIDASLTSPESAEDSALGLGEVTVPDLLGKSLRQAAADAAKVGLSTETIGSGRAISQQPPPGAHVAVGTRIRLKFSLR